MHCFSATQARRSIAFFLLCISSSRQKKYESWGRLKSCLHFLGDPVTNPSTKPCFFHQIISNAASATHQRKRLGLLFLLLAPTRLFCLVLSFYSNCVNTSSPHPFLVGSPLGGSRHGALQHPRSSARAALPELL